MKVRGVEGKQVRNVVNIKEHSRKFHTKSVKVYKV